MKNLNKMKIAGDMQFEIGQDKVSHFPTWEVKDDKTLCKKVEELKHSTFDKSKFTVVGSPTITDDGVVSGFSGSNFIRVPIAMQNAWKIQMKSTFTNISDVLSPLFVMNDFNRIILSNKGNIVIFASEDNATAKQLNFNKIALSINKDYLLTFEFDGVSTYTFTAKDLNTNTEYKQSLILNSKFYNSATNWAIGSDTSRYVRGSIDLKHFSITVDGKEVFSGNKTGLDVIKPDDYEVVGSPTITDDGVVSGFSDSNYLKINSLTLGNSLHNANSWKIIQEFTYNSREDWSTLFDCTGHRGISSFITPSLNNQFGYALSSDGTNEDISDSLPLSFWGLILGNTYKSVLEFTGTQYIHTLYNSDGTQFGETKTVTSSIKVVNSTNYYIGSRGDFTGSIDLNSFKIYVDGNLVYQPCLKIPYTQSKTCSKIVDVAYRDRVQDLFEQVGYNGYFTLGENDFTLPTHKFSDVIDCYENGINKWEQRVDRTLRQQGSCTSGTEVTLLKPYTDENYALSVPYSAKTASSFIPTATGDWFTEGTITL